MAILYGVKKVIVEELDPTTEEVKSASPIKGTIKTAEEIECEPVVSEGDEEILRNDNSLLAVVNTDDILYGYDLTLKDNTFNPVVAGLISGMTTASATDATNKDDKKLATPKLGTENPNKLFRIDIYIANYKGNSIVNYCKVTFNKCKGSALTFKAGKEFSAPEFTIKAREATIANKPIMEIDFVKTLPADATMSALVTADVDTKSTKN